MDKQLFSKDVPLSVRVRNLYTAKNKVRLIVLFSVILIILIVGRFAVFSNKDTSNTGLTPTPTLSIISVTPSTSPSAAITIVPTLKKSIVVTPTVKPATPTPVKTSSPTQASSQGGSTPSSSYTLRKSKNEISITPSTSDYEIYVTLLDAQGNVVINQSGVTYIWNVTNTQYANGAPFATCSQGITTPCPEDHFKLHGVSEGTTSVEVRAYIGDKVIRNSFLLFVHN